MVRALARARTHKILFFLKKKHLRVSAGERFASPIETLCFYFTHFLIFIFEVWSSYGGNYISTIRIRIKKKYSDIFYIMPPWWAHHAPIVAWK